MLMSLDSIRALTTTSEGYRGTAYLPTGKDVWTIGYGHTHGVKEGDTCTNDQALEWLHEDLSDAEDTVNRLVTVRLAQYQFDALVDFVYNVGEGNFAGSTLLRRVNQSNFASAKAEFGRWVYQGSEILKGLQNRRKAEADWFGGSQNGQSNSNT